MTKTATTTKKFLPKHGKWIHVQHRDTMRSRHHAHIGRAMRLPRSVPATPLPVDGTGNASVSCPMDGNDTFGDCMEAMACHTDNIWTFGRGQPGWTQSTFDLTTLERQYEAASGGDNGLDEPTLLTQCWKPGLAGNQAATYVDSLDIDFANDALLQYAIDQFFAVQMMWSIPDDFLQNFATGSVWPNAGIADPANGHGTPLADVNANGFYRLWTWGGWAWVSPAFIKSVDPAGWVTFSARQFNSQGYDAKGRHITKQAAKWVACGGNVIPASVLNAFPPIVGPGPTPTPPIPPVPPTPQPGPGPSVLQRVLAAVDGLFAKVETMFGPGSRVFLESFRKAIDAAITKAFGASKEYRDARGLNFQTLLQEVETLLRTWGPLALPFVNAIVEGSSLNPLEKSIIEQLIAQVLGGAKAMQSHCDEAGTQRKRCFVRDTAPTALEQALVKLQSDTQAALALAQAKDGTASALVAANTAQATALGSDTLAAASLSSGLALVQTDAQAVATAATA